MHFRIPSEIASMVHVCVPVQGVGIPQTIPSRIPLQLLGVQGGSLEKYQRAPEEIPLETNA